MSGASLDELNGLLDELQSQSETPTEVLRPDGGLILRRVMGSAADPDPEVRLKACCILGSWLDGCSDAEEPELAAAASDTLVRLMRKDPKAKVRWSAVIASQGIKPSPLPHLLAATKDRSCTVRYYVAFALSCYTARYFQAEREPYRPMVREGLLKLLADKDESVREWAALGLGIGGHDTTETHARLWQAMEDPAPDVAGAAASSLIKFRDPGIRAAIVRLLEAEKPAPNTFDAARKLGDPTLLPLVQKASARLERTLDADPGATVPRWDLQAIEALSKLERMCPRD